MRFSFVIRVRDGEIVDSREYYDSMSLMVQLGLMPDPAQAAAT
jgi:ketosteroid isomerase-like protein